MAGWILHITAPDGTVTRNRPVTYSAHAALAVAAHLATVAPWMTERERKNAGLQVAAHSPRDYVHTATGYRFRIDQEG